MPARQIGREVRVIPRKGMPEFKDEVGKPLVESEYKRALRDWGMQILDSKGANNLIVLCNGYWCPDRKCSVDRKGNPWPGIFHSGGKGVYRTKRIEKTALALLQYKNGNNGGRKRLMLDKRPEESKPEINLTPEERLSLNMPRIMGDG